METSAQLIGLIAGAGEVPVYFAEKAKARGIKIISISLTDEISTRLAPHVDKNFRINIGQPGKIFKAFKAEDVTGVVIMGKIEKSMIFRLQMVDLEAMRFLKSLKNHQDKSFMLAVIDRVKELGGTVLDQKELVPELFPEKGVLTRKQPSKKILTDIEFGIPIARHMADQEIGQTLVVRNETVIAVEAVEGTDQTIERGCRLANGGCTVVKVSRTDQDYRFDAPGIGPHTVEGMIRGKASALALEAGRVMIIDRQRVVELADKAGLSIVCV